MPWPQEDQPCSAHRPAPDRSPARGGHRPRRAVPRRGARHHAAAALAHAGAVDQRAHLPAGLPGPAGLAAARLAVAVGEPAGAGGPPPATPAPASWRTRPLLAAGFLTAFGAHAIAANLGRYATSHHASLLELGVLLALYDGAEV